MPITLLPLERDKKIAWIERAGVDGETADIQGQILKFRRNVKQPARFKIRKHGFVFLTRTQQPRDR